METPYYDKLKRVWKQKSYSVFAFQKGSKETILTFTVVFSLDDNDDDDPALPTTVDKIRWCRK